MNLALAKYLDRYVGIVLCHLFAALHLFREMILPREGRIRVRRILLVKFWGIGNIVLLLPVLRAVRRRYPEAEIHFLTLRGNAEILAGNGDVDRVWTIDDRGALRVVLTLARALGGLRRRRIDLFVDFEQFSRTSTLFGFLLGAPQRVGLQTPRQGRYLLYTAPVRYRDDQHMAHTFLDIARAAGVRATRYVPLPFPFSPVDAAAVKRLLPTTPDPIVVFHVGSGDNFVGRRWPVESFARAADRILSVHSVAVVFTGTRRESGLVREVTSRISDRGRVSNLAGLLSLGELAALLDRAALLISNDTGPVHIASSLGRPVLAFYGPNTPTLYGPLSPGSRAFYEGLPCSPCITNLNYKTSFCRLPVCIENIGVGEVVDAATRVLSRLGAPAVEA